MIIFLLLTIFISVLTMYWIFRPLWRVENSELNLNGERQMNHKTAFAVAVTLIIGTLGLYASLGPVALSDFKDQDTAQATPEVKNELQAQVVGDEQIKQMVASLGVKLEANPNNPNGWVMLLRSYKVLGRYDDADVAFVKAKKHIGENTALMSAYEELKAARHSSK